MGVQVKYGTIAVGAYMAHQPGTHQLAFTDQYLPKWDRGGARGPRQWKNKNRWNSLWSWGCRAGFGTPMGSDGASSRDLAFTDLFEPFSCDGDGCQGKRFLKGTVVDASDVPVSGAIVQGFVTATDAYVGEVQSREDGSYDLGTETLPGVPHYLVAYKPGSPDVGGTTVNTLTSTNVDGT